MDPILGEALLFLKSKPHLETIKEVVEAIHWVKENKKKQNMQKKRKEHQENEELLTDVANIWNLEVSVPIMYVLE